nr:SDR family oxidoreductase [Sunxiuqinia sp.]
MRKIIINGANGYVAANFINQLLLNDYEVIAFVRANKHSPEERMHTMLVEMNGGERVATKNLKVYGYGLDDENLAIPVNELTQIFEGQVDYLHFAASLKYDSRSKTEIFKTNLKGLENSIQVFLKNTGQDSRFFFISTAYSCGKFTGLFEEKFYPDAEISSFRNYYEQSKRLAENIISKYRDEAGLNGYILRLSQVVGHSETGVTKTDYGIFDFAKRVYSLAKRYPNKTIRVGVDPDSTQNLIPIDTAVNFLVRTVETEQVPVVMNFVAKNSIKNRLIADSLNALLPIQIVPVKGLAKSEMDAFERIISKGMSFTIGYAETNLTFDTKNLDSVMAGINNEVDEQAIESMLRYFIVSLSDKKGKQKLGFAV